jgi:hypothetical protein
VAYESQAAGAFSGRPTYDLFIYIRRDQTDAGNNRATYAYQVIARWHSGSPRAWNGTTRICYISVGPDYREIPVVLDFRNTTQIIIYSGVTGWITHDGNGDLNIPFATQMVNAGEFGNASAGGVLNADRIVRPATAPAAPTMYGITDVTASGLTVNFGGSADNGGSPVTNYAIQYALDAAFTVGVGYVNTLTGSTPIGSLPSGQLVYTRVLAQNAIGNSPWSAVASARTLSGARVAKGNAYVTAEARGGKGNAYPLAEVRVAKGGSFVPAG